MNPGIRSSSIEAHDHLIHTGDLSRQESQVLKVVQDMYLDGYADVTRKELSRRSGFEINVISARVNALVADGHLVEMAKRRCRITGRKVIPLALAPQHYPSPQLELV